MKDPRRLLEDEGTAEERALLRAGASEEPPADGSARLLAALGVTAPVVTTPGEPQTPVTSDASGLASAGGQAAASGGYAAVGGGLGAAGAAKLALLALGGAALLAAGAALWSRDGVGSAGGNVKGGVNADANENADPNVHQGPAGGAKPTGAIALEIEALERARSQLAREDGRGALTTLQRYARRHPSGALAHEADVLRVEAYLLAGEATTALQLAQQLLEQHGNSPHRARLQTLARQARARSAP